MGKKYLFKVVSAYSSDRNSLARVILSHDEDAVIKFKDNFSFKVKTKMNYSELFNLLIKIKMAGGYSESLKSLKTVKTFW